MRSLSCASSLFVGFVGLIGCTPITGGLGNSEGGGPVGNSSSTAASDEGTATTTTATATTSTADTTATSDAGVTSDEPPGGSTSPLDGSTSDGSTSDSTSAATEGGSTGGPPPQSLPELECTEEGTLASIDSMTSADVTFYNVSGAPRRIFWLDYAGMRFDQGTMQPDDVWGFGTYVTHPWLIADDTGACLTIFMTEAGVHDIDLY